MMKTTTPYLIGIIILLVAFLVYTCAHNSGEADKRKAQQAEEIKRDAHQKAELARIKTETDRLYTQKVSDSLRAVEIQEALKRKETRLVKTIADLKRTRSDSGIRIDTFSVQIEKAYDSVILVKNVQIDSLKADKITIEANFREIILKEQEKTSVYQVGESYWKEATASERKANKKLRRKNTLLKIGIGAAVGFGLYQTIK